MEFKHWSHDKDIKVELEIDRYLLAHNSLLSSSQALDFNDASHTEELIAIRTLAKEMYGHTGAIMISFDDNCFKIEKCWSESPVRYYFRIGSGIV